MDINDTITQIQDLHGIQNIINKSRVGTMQLVQSHNSNNPLQNQKQYISNTNQFK